MPNSNVVERRGAPQRRRRIYVHVPSYERSFLRRTGTPGSRNRLVAHARDCWSERVLVAAHNGTHLMLTTPFSEYGYQLPLTSGAHEFSYTLGFHAFLRATKPSLNQQPFPLILQLRTVLLSPPTNQSIFFREKSWNWYRFHSTSLSYVRWFTRCGNIVQLLCLLIYVATIDAIYRCMTEKCHKTRQCLRQRLPGRSSVTFVTSVPGKSCPHYETR